MTGRTTLVPEGVRDSVYIGDRQVTIDLRAGTALTKWRADVGGVFSASWADAWGDSIVCKVVPIESTPPLLAHRERAGYEALLNFDQGKVDPASAVGRLRGNVFDDEAGFAYFVLDRYGRSALQDRIGDRDLAPTPALDVARAFVRDGYAALRRLHAAKVIMRDVHPGNFLRDARDDGTPRYRLIDLGHSRVDGGVIETVAGPPGMDGEVAILEPYVCVQNPAFVARRGQHRGAVDDYLGLAISAYSLLSHGLQTPWLSATGRRVPMPAGPDDMWFRRGPVDDDPSRDEFTIVPDEDLVDTTDSDLWEIIKSILILAEDVDELTDFVENDLPSKMEELAARDVEPTPPQPRRRVTYQEPATQPVAGATRNARRRTKAGAAAEPVSAAAPPLFRRIEPKPDHGVKELARMGDFAYTRPLVVKEPRDPVIRPFLRRSARVLLRLVYAVTPTAALVALWLLLRRNDSWLAPEEWGSALVVLLLICLVVGAIAGIAHGAGALVRILGVSALGSLVVVEPSAMYLVTRWLLRDAFLGLPWDLDDWTAPCWVLFLALTLLTPGLLIVGIASALASKGSKPARWARGIAALVTIVMIGIPVAASASPLNDSSQLLSSAECGADAVSFTSSTQQVCVVAPVDWSSMSDDDYSKSAFVRDRGLPARGTVKQTGIAVAALDSTIGCLSAYIGSGMTDFEVDQEQTGESDWWAGGSATVGLPAQSRLLEDSRPIRVVAAGTPYAVWASSSVDTSGVRTVLEAFRPYSFALGDLGGGSSLTSFGSSSVTVEFVQAGCGTSTSAEDAIYRSEVSLLDEIRVSDRQALDTTYFDGNPSALQAHGLELVQFRIPVTPGSTNIRPDLPAVPVSGDILASGRVLLGSAAGGDDSGAADIYVTTGSVPPMVRDSDQDHTGWRQSPLNRDVSGTINGTPIVLSQRFERVVTVGHTTYTVWVRVTSTLADMQYERDLQPIVGDLLGQIAITGTFGPTNGRGVS